MGERLQPMEKLARDICWVGFSSPGSVGLTKAEYWRSLSISKRGEYIGEANRIRWLIGKLGVQRFQEAL